MTFIFVRLADGGVYVGWLGIFMLEVGGCRGWGWCTGYVDLEEVIILLLELIGI